MKAGKTIFWLLLLSSVWAWSGCTSPALPLGGSTDPWQDAAWRYDRVRQASWEQPLAESEPRQFALEEISSEKIVGHTKQLVGMVAKPEEARLAYDEAQRLYADALARKDTDLYLAAARKFEQAAKLWPGSSLEPDALFYAGESYFYADHYLRSNEVFEILLARYPNTKYLDLVEARRFSTAQYWLEVDQLDHQSLLETNFLDDKFPWRDRRGQALRVFDRIRLDDPTGRLADDATLAHANAHFAAGKYDLADQYYTDLRTNFPSSEHQFTAHLLGLESKLKTYRGPDYGGAPLDEAEQVLKALVRQFPHEVQSHREQLARAHAKIRFSRAEREWATGAYYDRRRQYRAAAFHYQLVLKDYADTPFADRAQQRLQQIEGEPPTPPERLSWLINLFPTGSPEDPLMDPGDPILR